MELTVEAIKDLFEFNNKLYREGIFTLDDETARKRISESANPVIWLAGHLTMTRTHILELVAERIENPWYKLFRKAYDPGVQYPPMADIKEFWNQVSDPMLVGLAQLDSKDLSRDVGYDMPHGHKTLGGVLAFWIYHEGWHLGQIAYIRKCLGMDGLVPY